MNRIIFLALLFFASTVQAETAAVYTAPDFELVTTDGTKATLSDFQGKVVYLDFWASWCGPCKLSFPDMNQLRSEFSPDDLEILAVSVDSQEADALRFVRRAEPTFTILLDPAGEVAAAYELPSMPTSFLIDQAGNVRYQHVGYRPGDMDALKAKVKELLHEDH